MAKTSDITVEIRDRVPLAANEGVAAIDEAGRIRVHTDVRARLLSVS
jgi:hypothetical protein